MLKYMGRLLKNKEIKKQKKMKHQFNRTLYILTPIRVRKFSKFVPHPITLRLVTSLASSLGGLVYLVGLGEKSGLLYYKSIKDLN